MRRERIKSLMEKTAQAFVSKTTALTSLRNWHDHISSGKRQELKEAIEALKGKGSVVRALLGDLCERGSEECDFLLGIRKILHKASEKGSQAARRKSQS